MNGRTLLSAGLLSLCLAATSAWAIPVPFSYTQTDASTGSGTLAGGIVASPLGQTTLMAAAPAPTINQKDATAQPIPAGMVGFVSVQDTTVPTAGSANGVHLGWSGVTTIAASDGLGNTVQLDVPLVLQSGTPFNYNFALTDNNSGVGGTNDVTTNQTLAGFIGNDGSGHRHTAGTSTFNVGPNVTSATAANNLGPDGNNDNLGISAVLRSAITPGQAIFIDTVTFGITLQSNDSTLRANGLPLPAHVNDFDVTVDIGAIAQDVQSGHIGVSGAANNANGINLPLAVVSTGQGMFTLALDNVNQAGATAGGLDWRDRGNSTNSANDLVDLGEDFVKNNAGVVRLTLGNLAEGLYTMTSYHLDATNTQAAAISVFVDTGMGYLDTGVDGNANFNPGVNLNTADVLATAATFSFVSDGINPVRIVFNSAGSTDLELPFNGFRLQYQSPIPEPATATLLAASVFGLIRRRRRAA